MFRIMEAKIYKLMYNGNCVGDVAFDAEKKQWNGMCYLFGHAGRIIGVSKKEVITELKKRTKNYAKEVGLLEKIFGTGGTAKSDAK